MYRALIEATAYGTREIIENYRKSGVGVSAFTASGGIPNKNPMLCQIYSDVLNIPVRVVSSTQGPALGAAIFGAVAAGKAGGGYDDIYSAGEKMGATEGKTYDPNPENVKTYDKLFAEYEKLHDCFGRTDDMMKRLRAIATGKQIKGTTMKFYFITGAQDLYGEETLRLVAKNSRAIVNGLNKAGTLPFKLELKNTAISDSAITEVMLEANSDPTAAA